MAIKMEEPKEQYLFTAEKAAAAVKNFDHSKADGAARVFLNLDAHKEVEQRSGRK